MYYDEWWNVLIGHLRCGFENLIIMSSYQELPLLLVTCLTDRTIPGEKDLENTL